MQVLPSVDAGRSVHHRDGSRAWGPVPTCGSDLRDRAVGGHSDSGREVFVVVVGWGRVGLAGVDFGEGWI